MRGRWKALFAAAVIVAPRCSTAPPCSNHSAPHASFDVESGCAGYYCAMTCDQGFADCDSNQANGCETSTTSGLPPHTVLDPNAADTIGCGESAPSVGSIGSCKIECAPGFFDCDHDTTNGCETKGTFGCPLGDASSFDASKPDGTHMASLSFEPHGLVACAGLDFVLDGSKLRAIDPSTFFAWDVASSPAAPLDGLACDGARLFWSTPSVADGGPPDGALWAVPASGGIPAAIATGFDAASGVDVRDGGVLAMSSAGLLLASGDGGLAPWMTATPTDAYKPFALGSYDAWSIAGGSIVHRDDDGGESTWLADAGAPAALLLAGGRPVASIHATFGDAGPTSDLLARLDDDAGAPALGTLFATAKPIVAAASGSKAIVATDDTIYLVSGGQVSPLFATTDHVVDVAIDGTNVVWTTRGAGVNPAGVYQGAIP